ncbi:MAG: D-ribose pyranase [Armatimonadetes bacterium]|nr:D-ribose pyranase [Armatimonadota bacterium]MBI2973627.1 D-ribose pyranase [Armatimonadota bacterium]
MKKGGILNPQLLLVIASMGHTDTLVIADSGLPIPADVLRIDLTLVAGVPPFLQTLEAVLKELQVEGAVVADEMIRRSPDLYRAVRRVLEGIPLETIAHDVLKSMLPRARAVIRTGEQTPYANIILRSGVVF